MNSSLFRRSVFAAAAAFALHGSPASASEIFGPALPEAFGPEAPAAIAALVITENNAGESGIMENSVTAEDNFADADEFAASLNDEDLHETRGAQGVTAEILASVHGSSTGNQFDVVQNGISNRITGSFNNSSGIITNVQVNGPGAVTTLSNTVNVYLVTPTP